MSGTDKDHTVAWDFFCTKGRNSGKWTTIPVPSCWELQGFGRYDYGHVKLAEQGDEEGLYKYRFKVDKQWKGQKVKIVFEGSMTDTEVKINGKQAGNIHQGAFYRFSYDISDLLKYGTSNLLEVKVSKKSANYSVNQAERVADFWIFGGIFRPVYLEMTPIAHIERVTIDAKADGNFGMEVFTQNLTGGYIKATISNVDNDQQLVIFGEHLDGINERTFLKVRFDKPELWSPEFPNLYKITVSLQSNQGRVIHTIEKKFGFRTVELRRGDGFYLNDKKVIFKGVNRHSFWPESGRTLSKALSIEDVTLMKDMNMNAVRMSHYPPDQHFLDACDSMGLMVIDELTGWQKMYDDTTAARLVSELVPRDQHHPAIVLWANGNEGGFNRTVDQNYHFYDPQKRHVIHPWEKFNGTDTKHYPDYNYMVNASLYQKEVLFPTEFMHGLYDGGHGAGLDDFWNIILKYPIFAGGFLWVYADEGVVRGDKNDSIDTWTNNAPDGIVGPYHQKEGSYYTIKEIWSPVYIETKSIKLANKIQLPVENRFLFTNLDQCTFQYKLMQVRDLGFSNANMISIDSGQLAPISVKPGEKGILDLQISPTWLSSDILYITAKDPHNKEIATWSFPLDTKHDKGKGIPFEDDEPAIKAKQEQNILIIQQDKTALHFDTTTGMLAKVVRNGRQLSLSNGPVLAGFEQQKTSFIHKEENEVHTVEVTYKGNNNWLNVTWTIQRGQFVKLTYTYSQRGEADYMGITFNYPEEKVKGMKWLGRGPYHVWKNRLKGQQYGVWEKAYNNTITGERGWQYPEFKGNHAEVAWVTVQTNEFPFTVYTEDKKLFFQMLKPESPKGAYNSNTTVNYPAGNIGFLNAIQPIGTKFQPASAMGPQSQKNVQLNAPYTGTLWFDFR
ncbi:MAG: glycoside hydrolase family 2 [Niastella sp.]|nr:glycoside hydrolase family 2 [Niastella sp.]